MTVSVVVPCYNYGRFLEEAVDSVLRQSVSDLEVIIVDDGSVDGTPEVANSLARRDPRVRSFRTEHRGPAHARNLGLSQAEGPYIAYLDADDRWRPNKLERQLLVMEREPSVVMLFSNAVRFTGDTFLSRDRFSFLEGLRSIPARPSKGGTAQVLSGDPLASLLALPMLAPTPSTTILRASAVRHLRWRHGLHPAEDFAYLTCVCRYGEVAYSDEVLVETRRHGDNSYTDRLVPMITTIKALTVLLKDSDEKLEAGQHRVVRHRLGRAWCALGWYYFWRRRPISSAAAYARALTYPGVRANALRHLLATPCVPFLPSREYEDETFI
jgi:glycosyltransferase involved in cell wall biosynthesis